MAARPASLFSVMYSVAEHAARPDETAIKCFARLRRMGTHHALFRLGQRPVLAVHLVVESAGVAEVVSVAVASPQRRGGGAAVDTLAALCNSGATRE